MPMPPSRVAAFFDVDRTLVACNSGRLFVGHLRQRGNLSTFFALRAMGWLGLYHFSMLDLHGVAARAVRLMQGHREEDFIAVCEDWVEKVILPQVLPQAIEAVKHHQAQGHKVALVSTSLSYIVAPLARAIGVPRFAATQLEVRDGCFTGQLQDQACFGEQKKAFARALASTGEIDLTQSWFYTDSLTDLPLLEAVGNPVVVNPDPRLARVARKRQWPLHHWRLGQR